MLYLKLSRGALLHRGVSSVLALTLTWALPVRVHADVWKYVDEKGVIHYTNEPPNNNAQKLFQSTPEPPGAGASSANPAVRASAPAPAPSASAALPLNPFRALGDWPPRSLIPAK